MTRIRKNLCSQSTVWEVSEQLHFLHIEKDDKITKETGFKNVFSYFNFYYNFKQCQSDLIDTCRVCMLLFPLN